ncbi:HSF-type DNA-binding [Mucilaginibacter lappiensis]|nr:HSF-type DNA-binding [Mucilaginibacter lappiensis]
MIMAMSCSSEHQKKRVTKDVVDNFIKKYHAESFSEFKNVFISIRETNGSSSSYILQKNAGNLPVYVVTYNENTNEIVEVNNSRLRAKKVDDYFTSNQITSFIKKFRYYKFCLLSVDAQGNVFINPFYPGNPAIFLRISKTPSLEISKISGDYIYYKDNWYVNRTQLVDLKL